MYFRSAYNSFVVRPEGVVGYNCRTGVFALLSIDIAKSLQSDQPLDEVGDVDSLLEMGFIHRGDEKNRIFSLFEGARETETGAHITLVPTMACNFHCDYCYQNEYRSNVRMEPGTQRATLSFIVRLIQNGRTEISVDWYGGEPLLEVDTVCSMTTSLREIAQRHGTKLSRVNAITNGTLLTKEVARRLATAGVTEAQVSIDSLTYEEGSKRGVVDKDGKLSIIMENILQAEEFFPVLLRINVSHDNFNDVDRITDAIKASSFKGSFYMARVHAFEKDTGYVTDREGRRMPKESLSLPILDASDIATLSRPMFAEMDWKHLKSDPRFIQRVAQRLTPKVHFCSATTDYGFVIDPGGYISRCWHSAGSPSEAIGNVLEPESDIAGNSNAKKWQTYIPLAYPACESCKVLPLCMGGCSHPRLFMEAKKPPCESIKFQIHKAVEILASRISLETQDYQPAPVA